MVDISKVKAGNLITSDLIKDMAKDIDNLLQKTVKFDDNGNVGIGTANPTHKFHVLSADAVGLFESTGSQAYLRLSTNEGLDNRVEITNRAGGRLSLWTARDGDAFNITRDGKVGIGTTDPKAKLHLYSSDNPTVLRVQSSGGFGKSRIEFWSDPQGSANEWRPSFIESRDDGNFTGGLVFGTNGSTLANRTKEVEVMRIANSAVTVSGNLTVDGNVGIMQKLDVSGNIRIGGSHTHFAGSITEGEYPTIYTHRIMGNDGTEALRFEISREGGIISNKFVKISDEWTFYSKQKNFLINHPLDPEHKDLVHSALECPEAAVFYRGEAQLSNGEATVLLPDYFEALTRKENRTILLTPKFEDEAQVSMLATSEVKDGKFTVKMIDHENPSQKFYWEVKAVRADVGILKVEQMKAPAEKVGY